VAGLRHANIVQVYDVGEHKGLPYFTLEYIEGGSLAQRLLGTPLGINYAAVLVGALAEAVQVAHQHGIIHRDLKPSNLLLQSKSDSQTGNANPLTVVPTPLSDFDPKIVDFGLARHFERDSSLTLSGARVGTPSYMAPEQAMGKTHAIGPAVDIYSLGAILYELVTGRPPFKGETATETQLQVIHHDPVPPSRLNPRVPRDLETICLKCLEKDPARRYATAAALADDLRRLEEGRPIKARPVGWGERLWRWCRRRPAAAALIATALALIGLALAGVRWLEIQQAERRAETARHEDRASQAVEARLEQAAILEKEGRWPEARVALEVAPIVLESPAQASLAERLRQAQADADIVAKLEEIRLRLSEGGRSRDLSPDKMYADAFRNYGIPVMTLEPAEAAARIRASSIQDTLLAFMHDWLFRLSNEDRGRLRDVLDRADEDDWRRAFRKALAKNDAGELSVLANAPEASAQPPSVVAGLAYAVLGNLYKAEAQEFMRKAQQRYPGDFWLNYFLGCFWCEDYPQEAVGYFRVAVAIRPKSEGAYLMLGRTLRGAGDMEGAMAALRRSVDLHPSSDVARELALCLAPKGELEEARAAWEKFLESDPPDHDSWYGYAQLCLFLGYEDAYRRARTALLKRFGDTRNDWVVAERTSQACLLLNDSGEELRAAIRLANLAVAAERPKADNPYLQFVNGLALYRDRRPIEAIPLLQEAAEKLPHRAGPRLALAMAQFQAGATSEARKTLAAAVRAYNWNAPTAGASADLATIWLNHVLRREAETLILPNVPGFLQGTYQPRDNDERMALLGICQARGLHAAAARLYADAFKADPGLPDSLTAECFRRAAQANEAPFDLTEIFNAACRYRAARSAALAACGPLPNPSPGRGEAWGEVFSEPERARWRKQARDWLRAALAMWTRKLDHGSPFEQSIAKGMLTNWQSEPDLAGLRDPQALDDLAPDERKDCLALWQEVRASLKVHSSSFSPHRSSHSPHSSSLIPHTQAPAPDILLRLGRLNEAKAAWKSVLKTDPPDHSSWNGYAELCLFLGDEDEYRRVRRDLLERFGDTSDPYVAERAGRACLLMPGTEDELARAVAIAERAAARNSGDRGAEPYFEFTRGFAEFRLGHYDRAIALMRGDAATVMGPAPGLVIAMALHRKGRAGEASKTLASAVLAYDWSANHVRDIHSCIQHSLRREAERMILPNLPAFLEGKFQPQNNDERLAFLGACQFLNRTRAMARLYADAFAADPALANDLDAGHRYNAARAAAQVGAGHAADATGVSDKERARWRQQARQWLRVDLTARARALDAASPATHSIQLLALTRWKTEPDLACLRYPEELKKLPADERQECGALWAEVGAVIDRGQK
jgi:serine/threonine-protein kinase